MPQYCSGLSNQGNHPSSYISQQRCPPARTEWQGKCCHKEHPLCKEPAANNDNIGKYTQPLTSNELDAGIYYLLSGNATGLDEISLELIQHFGIKARLCLLGFFNQ